MGGNITLAGGMVINTGHISTPENTVNLLAVQPETAVQMSDRADILEVIEPTVASELESDLGALEQLSEETGLRVTETGDYEILGTGITVSPETGLTVASGEIDAMGGTVRVLGDKVGLVNANIDVSGENGGGTVHIGGNYRGKNSLLNASRTWVNGGTNITADALGQGDGGTAIVWADETTAFSGNISARGGNIAGDGGFVEVSGKENLHFSGMVNVGASQGNAGTLLLDPENITIKNGNSDGDDNSNLTNMFGNNLAGDNGQVLATDTMPSIIFESELEGLSGNIKIEATNNIIVEDISDNFLEFASGIDSITFKADLDGDGSGNFVMNDVEDVIQTNGRNLTISGASITVGTLNNAVNVSTIIMPNLTTTGKIKLTATNGNIQTGNITTSSIVNVLTHANSGTTGNVELMATNGNIQTGNINTNSITKGLITANSGTTGNVELIATNGNIQTGNINTSADSLALIEAHTDTTGRVKITANNGNIQMGNIDTFSSATAGGNIMSTSIANSETAGAVKLTATNEIKIGNINTSSFANVLNGNTNNATGGDGGDITLNARDTITLPDSISSSGLLKGGDVTITSQNGSITGNLFVINTGKLGRNNQMLANLVGLDLPPLFDENINNFNGGDLALSAARDIQFDRGIISASGAYNLKNSAQRGAGGLISVNSGGNIIFDRVRVSSTTEFGNGNNIEITGRSLSMTIQSSLGANAVEMAEQSGNIIITAPEFIDLKGESIIQLRTQNNSTGNNILLNQTNRLTIQDSLITAFATTDNPTGGQAGTIIINANLLDISGVSANGLIPSGLANVSSRQGRSGGIIVNSDRISLFNGGGITTTSIGKNPGGDINIDANIIHINGTSENQLLFSGIIADALTLGNGGNINITSDELTIENGGRISSSTFGIGRGGTINIDTPKVFLRGTSADGRIETGIYAQSFDAGHGGSINMTATNLNLENRAKITVSSDPQAEDSGNVIGRANALVEAVKMNLDPEGTLDNFRVDRGRGNGDAGNINISIREQMTLNNQTEVVAETSSGEGGNINLEIGDLLLMRHESKISTTAGTAQAGGNGGNITINTPNGFIVAPPQENSDITANAFEGNGGNIRITAQALFGIKVRDELTRLSDITASSEFGLDGTVQLNTIGIDPSNGLTNLPEEESDPQVRQGCPTGGANTSSLNIPGRGGFPDNPDDMLTGEIDKGFIPLDELETDGGIEESEEEVGMGSLEENQTAVTFSCL